MTRTEFRKLYFFSNSLQRTSHDFEKNRKTILVEMNQSLLSWEVSQPPPYAQKRQPAPAVSCQEQQEATTHHGSEFENSLKLAKLQQKMAAGLNNVNGVRHQN